MPVIYKNEYENEIDYLRVCGKLDSPEEANINKMKGGVKSIQLLLCGANVRMRKFLTSLVLCLSPKPKPSGFLGLWNLNLYHMPFF